MESERVDATVAVEGEARRRRRGAVREQVEVASDRPVRPERGVADGARRWVGADAKPMQTTPAVENVAAATVGQQPYPLGDTPSGPVRGAVNGGRTAELVQTAPPVEHVPGRVTGA